eukprot:4207382-Amphidinium_carterae.1
MRSEPLNLSWTAMLCSLLGDVCHCKTLQDWGGDESLKRSVVGLAGPRLRALKQNVLDFEANVVLADCRTKTWTCKNSSCRNFIEALYNPGALSHTKQGDHLMAIEARRVGCGNLCKPSRGNLGSSCWASIRNLEQAFGEAAQAERRAEAAAPPPAAPRKEFPVDSGIPKALKETPVQEAFAFVLII